MDNSLAIALAALTGLGLAAAAGFRVFVPLLILSLAARAGVVELSEGFAWIATLPALAAFAVATVLEIAGYFLPFVDNLLDAVATPAAAVAGALLATSVLVDFDPWLRWTFGVVAGAGVATAIQLPLTAVRGSSSATTGGTANPAVATGELAGASIVSGMAVLAPLAVPLVVIALVVLMFAWRRHRRRAQA